VDLAEQEKIVKEFTGGRGVDVVLDCVGAQNVPLTTAVFALDARWVLYGLLGGAIVKEPPFNFSALFAKRA
jgi:tumor protein p53-inducible protein 3